MHATHGSQVTWELYRVNKVRIGWSTSRINGSSPTGRAPNIIIAGRTLKRFKPVDGESRCSEVIDLTRGVTE